MWLLLKSTHMVAYHPITVVHPWKILVHPGVYDTPGWQNTDLHMRYAQKCIIRA